jgi:hypothetical protein
LLYSIAGFFWARHLFLNAQDTQWTGGEISFPWRRKISKRTLISSQPRHWFSALVRKEFQLHQGTILIAALVLALHLVSIAIRKVHPHFENPNVKFILEQVWALWLLMPLLIGCAAVAEERRLGIIESQLCLPVSRRAQLFIKFSVALIFSLILGGALPLLIERTKDLDFHIFYVAAIIFFISFYASTLARTTLQAVGITIGMCAGLWAWVVGVGFGLEHLQQNQYEPGNLLNQAFFMLCFSAGILLLALAWLTFGNFKWLHENWKLWRRNLIAVILSLAFCFVLPNVIYFRTWEFLAPIEPSHGAARLHDSSSVKFVSNGDSLSAILPDGRLWIETVVIAHYTNGTSKLLPSQSKAQFIDGSNWTEVAPNLYETLAIKSDGTLWNLQNKWDESRGLSPSKLTQMGSETNWSHVAIGTPGYFFLLLKNDESLWLWGTNQVKGLDKKLAADLATPPARVSDETNWTGLVSLNSVYARKNDGSFWTWNLKWKGTNSISHFFKKTNLSNEWMSFISHWNYSAGVKTDGEIWLLLNPPAKWNWDDGIPPYSRQIQLGPNAKWKAITSMRNFSLVALRSDGTLWEWPQVWNLTRDPDLAKPVQLGDHSDWVAISAINDWYLITLAADGSLWLWGEPSGHRWLAPSRKPVFIGNIFQGANSKTE